MRSRRSKCREVMQVSTISCKRTVQKVKVINMTQSAWRHGRDQREEGNKPSFCAWQGAKETNRQDDPKAVPCALSRGERVGDVSRD